MELSDHDAVSVDLQRSCYMAYHEMGLGPLAYVKPRSQGHGPQMLERMELSFDDSNIDKLHGLQRVERG